MALFLPARRPHPQYRRLARHTPAVLAVIGTVVLAAAVTAVLREFLHATRQNLIAGAAAVVFASLIWMPVTRRWSARAHVCWASSVFLFVVYLTYALDWTFTSHLGPVSTAGGVLLWVLEIFAAVLTCAYLWEIRYALGTEYWRRRITPRHAAVHAMTASCPWSACTSRRTTSRRTWSSTRCARCSAWTTRGTRSS